MEEDSGDSAGWNTASVAVTWPVHGPSQWMRQAGTDHRILVSFSPRGGSLLEDSRREKDTV